MFNIDFTKPFLYKDPIYFNQGNLSTNNTLRCTVNTGGDNDLTGCDVVCVFSTASSKPSYSGVIVDPAMGVIDIVFPTEALVVGVNKLEILINRPNGGVAQSPAIKYEVWQGLTTNEETQGSAHYPVLVELINTTKEALKTSDDALKMANDAFIRCYDATVNANTAIARANRASEEAILSAGNADTKTKEMVETVNKTLASGTQDLEVKASRIDMDGVEHGSLKERLESDLKKGKVIEETKEGNYISFDGSVKAPIGLELKGNTVQDPVNLADIKSTGIDNGDGTYTYTVVSCGENLFNGKFEIGSLNGVNGQEIEGASNCRSGFIRIGDNKKISWLLENISGGYIFTYDKDKKFISSRVNAGTYRNYALEDNAEYIRVRLQDNNVNTKMTIVYGILGLTNHISYEETRCDIKLPCQLEGIDTLQDHLYFDRGENAWVVDKKIDTWIPDNLSSATKGSGTNANGLYPYYIRNTTLPIGKALCSIAKYNYTWASSTRCFYIGASGELVFLLDEDLPINQFISKYESDLYIKYVKGQSEKIVLPQSEQIKLNSFANKTHIYTVSGEVDATVKATVSKSLASTVQANTEEINKINNTIADIQGLKESQDFEYETDKGYLVCKDTQNGVVKDLKIYGKSLVNLAEQFRLPFNLNTSNWAKEVYRNTKGRLTPFKTYTFVYRQVEGKADVNGVIHEIVYTDNTNIRLFDGELKPYGCRVFTPTKEIDRLEYAMRAYTSTSLVNFEVMILEGDWSNNTPDLFEGIASVGNGNEIEVLSRKEDGNLFDINADSVVKGVTKWIKTDDSFSVTTNTRYDADEYYYIEVEPNTDYTLSCESITANVILYDGKLDAHIQSNLLSSIYNTKPTTTIKSKSNIMTVRITNADYLGATSVVKLQLVKGANTIPYEHCKQDKKTILFKDTDNIWKPVTNLMGIDENNCDIIDSAKNKLYVNMVPISLNGMQTINSVAVRENTVEVSIDIRAYGVKPNTGYAIDWICDKLPSLQGSDDVPHIRTDGSMPNANLKLYLPKSYGTTKEQITLSLSTTPITFVGTLANTVEYEITPIYPDSFEGDTMVMVKGSPVPAGSSFKITSSLPNFVQSIEDRVSRLENDAYKTNLANFAVALNMLDMKARLRSLEAPIN